MALTQQVRYWDFLDTITAIKINRWHQYIIPSGLYRAFTYDLGVDAFTTTSAFKYVMPSGLIVEEYQQIQKKYPEISFGTREDYTFVAYREVSTTTEQNSTICYYAFVKGYYQQSNTTNIPIELNLSNTNEFLILGHLAWDGKQWSFVENTIMALDKVQTVISPPFQYITVSKNEESNFKERLDSTYGPVYEQTTGQCEIIVGYNGIIDNLKVRIAGGNTGKDSELRVKLIPETYAYTQSFLIKEEEDRTIDIKIPHKETPTKANSGIQLRMFNNIKLISITVN